MQLSPGFTVHISDNIALDEPEKAKELLTEFCAILQEYGTDLILDARETINIVSRQAMEQVRPPERVLQEQARQAHEKEYEANQKAAAAREKVLAARVEELMKEKGINRLFAGQMAEQQLLDEDRKRIAAKTGG